MEAGLEAGDLAASRDGLADAPGVPADAIIDAIADAMATPVGSTGVGLARHTNVTS